MTKIPMQLPYGAVYFRKSNPPREDWERDYAQASRDGYNIFRHWFMWGAIETAPGVYDWEDYDRQMELGERYGIKAIIAEMTTCVPEWVFTRYPEALCENADGRKSKSEMSVSCSVGGFYEGVCLDTAIGRELTGNFLEALAKRYKGHPSLLGYDVWNECNYSHDYCYCKDTKQMFRAWLKVRYGTLDALKEAWHRYSLTSWEEVQPPPKLALYTECNDWLLFRKEQAYHQMKWKTERLRAADPDCLITAHGTAQSLENMALGGSDEWMAGEQVEVYGLTFVQSRKGNEAYKQWGALDLTRSGARGKDFWHAESQGGPLWYQPQVVGRPREDGRITEPEDIRQWNLTSLAGGARGILCPRWRPLLDGPLFGAFGAYGMDGLPTPRSEMASRMAKWANAPEQGELLAAAPVQGEIGILVVPETQRGTFLLSQFGAKDSYSAAVTGAYRGFLELGYQPDFVHIDDLEQYRKVYLPLPVMLEEKTAKKLADWVERGGILFSEGCPGYLDGQCHVGTVQPNLGLDKVFGVREADVEFIQDILQDETISWEGRPFYGGEYLQTYRTDGAQVMIEGNIGQVLAEGKDDQMLTEGKDYQALTEGTDTQALAVEKRYGLGTAFLMGTSPALGYENHPCEEQREMFRWIAGKMGLEAHAVCDNPKVRARIQTDGEHVFLWLINESREGQSTKVNLGKNYDCTGVERLYWQGGTLAVADGEIRAELEGRNAVVAKLTRRE